MSDTPIRGELVSPAVGTLTAALNPLGASAGGLARTIACIVAEKQRLNLLDRHLREEREFRAWLAGRELQLRERDLRLGHDLEYAKLAASERATRLHLEQGLAIVDSLLTAEKERHIRQLSKEYAEATRKLEHAKFVADECGLAVAMVFGVVRTQIHKQHLNEDAIRESLLRAGRMQGSDVTGDIKVEAMATLGQALASTSENSRSLYGSLADTVGEQMRTLRASLLNLDSD